MNVEKELKLDKADEAYISSITKRYTDFLDYAQLPTPFYDIEVEPSKFPTRIKTLYDNIFEIIDDQLSYLFSVTSYHNTGYLTSVLLDAYFKQAITQQKMLKTVIYLDTNLVLDDYKKLMDMGNDDIALAHSRKTLLTNIETADYVIWDKLSFISSAYDRQKFYNLISNRYRLGLGNMFFVRDGEKGLAKFCDRDMLDMMNVDGFVVLDEYNFKPKDTQGGGNISW